MNTQKLLGPIDLIKRAWTFYKKNFRRLWPLFLLGGIGNIGFRFNFSGNSNITEQLHISTPTLVLIIAIGLIIGILLFLSKLALFKSISDVYKGQFIGVKDGYSKSTRLFWGFILLSIITTFSTIGAYVLFIIPGILLSGYLIFSSLEFFDKDKKNFKAVLGSWELIRGYWWAVFWRLALSSLVVGLITLLVVFVAAIPIFIAMVAGTMMANKMLVVAGVILGILAFILVALFIVMLIQPLGIIVLFELYYNLRSVRESDQISNADLDRKRKIKIIACLVVSGIVSIGLIFVGAFLLNKLSLLKSSNGSHVIIPASGVFTFEDSSDLFTIDYPTSWMKTDEVYFAGETYNHSMTFVPNTEYVALNEASTSIRIVSGTLPPNVKVLDDYKKFFQSLADGYEDTEVDSLVISTSTIGYFPSLRFAYNEKITIPATATTTAIVEESRNSIEIMVRGNYFNALFYKSSPSHFDKYLHVTKEMINSWYLYYTQTQVGDSLQYTNNDYGLSLLYPKDWIQVGNSPDEGNIAQFTSPEYADGYLVSKQTIVAAVTSFSGDIDAYKDTFLKQTTGDKNVTVDDISPIDIAGNKGYLMKYTLNTIAGTGRVYGKYISARTIRNKKLYQINFIGFKDNDPLISKTLTSAKILDPEPKAYLLTTHDNRQFGFSTRVPAGWSNDDTAPDFANLTVEGYIRSSSPSDKYIGVFGISIPDDYYINRDYDVSAYRTESIQSWKKGTDYVHNFELLGTGTTTVGRLPAVYILGRYSTPLAQNGEPEQIVKMKQTYVSKDGVVRFITYTDDEVDFAKYQDEADQIVRSIMIR